MPDKEKYRKQLMLYSKSDIIDVILDQFNWKFTVMNYMRDLHDRTFKRELGREKEASKACDATLEEYSQWIDTLKAKYGDGEKISMNMLTEDERNRTISLMQKMHRADEKLGEAINRVNGILCRMDSFLQEG